MVRKTHSFFSAPLPPPLRTSDTVTCHYVARLIPPRPVSWQENEILGSRASNGRRTAVSSPHGQKNSQLLFRFTPPTPAHLRSHHLPFCCTFDPPTPSLGRKMGFSGSGRVTDGAWPFHPRMVRKTHSFFAVPLPLSVRTSGTITCHFVARLIPPRPVSWQENEIFGSRASNGRRTTVSPPHGQKNSQLLFRFTLPPPLRTSDPITCH